VRGPFHLGAFSVPIAVAAVIWIAFIAIVFLLPQANVCPIIRKLFETILTFVLTIVSARGLSDAELCRRCCWNCDRVQRWILDT
jgi:hypothetical protein